MNIISIFSSLRFIAKKSAFFSLALAGLVTITGQNAIAQYTIKTIAGTGISGYTGDGGAAVLAEINGANAIAIDGAGNIYLTMASDHVVRKIDAAGTISTFAGNGTAGYTGDGGAATAAELSQPNALAVDASGNVYICDNLNEVVREVNVSTGIITTIAGTGGTAGYTGDLGSATSATLSDPSGIALDASGNLYIADYANYVVREVVAATGNIQTFAGNHTLGSSGDGGLATSAQLGLPACVAVDASGNVYIGDYFANVIRKVSASGIISTCAGTGTAGYTGDGGVATSAELATISGVAVDAAYNMYITDQSHNVIREVVASSGKIYTIAGNGTAGATGDGGPASAAELNFPTGVAVDAAGNKYIADESNSKIREITPNGIYFTDTPATLTTCENVTIFFDAYFSLTDTVTGEMDTISMFSGPAHGTVTGADTLLSTGSILSPTGFSYTPSAGYSGPDTFTLMAITGLDTTFENFYVMVNSIPAVATFSGTGFVCIGGAGYTFTDATAGGTWSTSNTNAAVTTDGIVTGIATGLDTIYYSLSNTCGDSTVSLAVAVDTLPLAGTITGISSLCLSGSTTLSEDSSSGGWGVTNGNLEIASGLIYAVAPGIDTVTYTITNACGTAIASFPVMIDTFPHAGTISGASQVCAGSSVTLTEDSTSGIWSVVTGNAAVSGGLVTGITAGIDTIKYAVTNVCGTAEAVHAFTVNPLPDAGAISGPSSVCVDANITLTDGATGGSWHATNTDASVFGGFVFGVSSGTDTIIYVVGNSCGSDTARKIITINPLPFAGVISGPTSVCVDGSITLSESVTGGAWSDALGNVSVAGATVTGVTQGTDTVKYTITNSCGSATATYTVTINPPFPDAGIITAPSFVVCVGSTITLTDAATGGTWSDAFGYASVSPSGVVTGINAGSDMIKYTVTNSCGTAFVTQDILINPLPFAGTISGVSVLCAGLTDSVSDGTSGGTWSASNGAVTITTGGVITAVSAGLDTISYAVTNSCGTAIATHIIDVNGTVTAGAIAGDNSVCVDSAILLTDPVAGGVWSVTNGSALISSGVVAGALPGLDTVLYSVTNTCGEAIATFVIEVFPASHCSPTGVANVANGIGEFKVYPNPSSGIFTIELPVANNNAAATITDIMGRVIVSRHIGNTQTATLDLSDLASGNYVLQVTAGGRIYHEQITLAR